MKFRAMLFFAILISALGVRAADPSVESFLSPPSDQGAVIVKVWFDLHNINEINDGDETFGFNGILRLTWKDARQAFDPATTGVSDKIYQGTSQIEASAPAWFPQVYLANESGAYETNAVTLRISPDGTSVLTSSINATAKSSLSMRMFPFDSQTLKADFQSPGFRADEVVFVAEGAEHAPSLKLSQWNLGGVKISEVGVGSSPGFFLNVFVKRDPLFIIRLVAAPLMLIVILSWSVFWMERSSLGDRISVSFVGILTAVAYQIVVGDLLPHVSYITVMHAFLNFSFFIMCASVMINLIVGAYDKNGKNHLGDIIDRRCRWIFPLVYVSLILMIYAVMVFLF